MPFSFAPRLSPTALFLEAKQCGLKLMQRYSKRSATIGWHDFFNTSDGNAGAHATLEGYLFLAHTKSQVAGLDPERDVFQHHLCRLFDENCTPKWDRPEQQIEALCTTIKVAKFILCADAGPPRSPQVKALTQALVQCLWQHRLKHDAGPLWGHFLDANKLLANHLDNTASWFASAVALEALAPRAGRDGIPADLLGQFCTRFLEEWNTHTEPGGTGRNMQWMRSALPVLRALAQLPAASFDDFRDRLPFSFEKLLRAYLTEQTFYQGNTVVETYRYLVAGPKVRSSPRKQRTDYVSYEDTLVLLSAVANAVRNRHVKLNYIAYCKNWLCFHRSNRGENQRQETRTGYAIDLLQLCRSADQPNLDIPPGKRRFSYIMAILECLDAVLETKPKDKETPMFVRPRIFKEHPYVLDREKAFVAMPFSAASSEAVWLSIEAVCKEFGVKAVRTDRESKGENKVIMHDIWEKINESEFVIAMCTGANANVYYEIGIADTLGKPVFLCGENNDDFRFDVTGNQRTIYNPTDTTSLREKLGKFLLSLDYSRQGAGKRESTPAKRSARSRRPR